MKLTSEISNSRHADFYSNRPIWSSIVSSFQVKYLLYLNKALYKLTGHDVKKNNNLVHAESNFKMERKYIITINLCNDFFKPVSGWSRRFAYSYNLPKQKKMNVLLSWLQRLSLHMWCAWTVAKRVNIFSFSICIRN